MAELCEKTGKKLNLPADEVRDMFELFFIIITFTRQLNL